MKQFPSTMSVVVQASGFSAQRLRYERRLKAALATVVLAALSGCVSMAPEDASPAAPIPSVYPSVSSELNAAAATELAWRSFFTDPVLTGLIETALENNRDLRTAILRVEEARSAFRIQRSDRFPTISVGGQGSRARVPADLSPIGRSTVASEYRAEVGLTSWEIDLWGRVRSLERSALENWLATQEASQAVQIALVAEVANGYLTLRELDQRVQVTRESVASREKSYRIFQRRYDAGATAKLEVTQVQTLLTQAQVMLAQLQQQREMQVNALRLLVGADAGGLLEQEPREQVAMLAELAPGLPSELLVNRPDIMAAEHRLRAANANIGAARAAFFPRVALTGSFGSASSELDGLFDSAAKPGPLCRQFLYRSLMVAGGGLTLSCQKCGVIWLSPIMSKSFRMPFGRWPMPWRLIAGCVNNWMPS